jgi:hypothetical protein
VTLVAGLSLVLVPLVAPALLGCTVSESFDPTGGDVAVSASWTIEGGAATAESCEAACIGMVQLRVWEQYEGGDDYTQDEWIVDCADGSLTTQPILVPDTYRVGLYGVTEVPDGGACPNRDVQAAAIEEVSAETGGTLSVSLDLSPEPE